MITTSKIFRTLLWPNLHILLLGLVLIVINRLSSLVLPATFKYFIDDVLIEKDNTVLTKMLWVLGIAIFIQTLTMFLLTRFVGLHAHKKIADLRVTIQKRVLDFPIQYFNKNKTGSIAKRIMDDVDGLDTLIGQGMVSFIGGIITFFCALVLLFFINVKLTLYILIPLIFLGLTAHQAYKKIRPHFRKRRAIEATVHGRLIETLGGIYIIKAYNALQQEAAVFTKGVATIYKYYQKTLTSKILVLSVTTFAFGLCIIGILWIGSTMIANGELTIGAFLSFAMYLAFMIVPIIQVGNVGSLITEALAGIDRIDELLNLETETSQDNRTITLPSLRGDIIFKDVYFSYTSDSQVLTNINFNAKPGSITALVGSSGAGKSTIAALVAGLILPEKGTISIDGYDITKVTLESYRAQLGMVLQDDFLFAGTIRENILFANPEATEAQLQNAINSAYVNEFTDRFKNGIDTIIGERGVRLSGGQKQRISIARALLADPKILILDEATSNLDVESEWMIQESLAKLFKGRTTIIIAHRLSTIQKADEILILENGKIMEQGNHESLFAKKGRYYELLSIQSRI